MKKNKTTPAFSLVVPCYNEALNIERNLHWFVNVLRSHFGILNFEVIAVNDGSADNTNLALLQLKKDIPELKVISYDLNQGKGFAVRKGVQAASAPVVSYLDADGEISPSHLIKYYKELQKGYDLVLGSKANPSSNIRFSLFRVLISRSYRLLNKFLFNLDVVDTQVGVKVFTADVAQNVFPLMKTKGFAFDIEFLSLTQSLGFVINEEEVIINHSQDNSSVSVGSLIKVFVETCKIRSGMNRSQLRNTDTNHLSFHTRLFL